MYEFSGEPHWQDFQMGICPFHSSNCNLLDRVHHHGNLVDTHTLRRYWHWHLCRLSCLEEPSWRTMVSKGGRAMTGHQIELICWKASVWRRSLKREQVHEMLVHLATISSRGAVIWKIHARKRTIPVSLWMFPSVGSTRFPKSR